MPVEPHPGGGIPASLRGDKNQKAPPKRSLSVCAPSIRSELVAQADRDGRLRKVSIDRTFEQLVGLVAEIAVAKLGTSDPVRREGVFGTDTSRPADMRIAVVGTKRRAILIIATIRGHLGV